MNAQPSRQTAHDLRQHWQLTQRQAWHFWQQANIARLQNHHPINDLCIGQAHALEATLRYIQTKHALLCGWQANDEFFNP